MERNFSDLLLPFVVPGLDQLFVLGCLERRVTLYSQQTRAINLAYLLHASKALERRTRVLVVGAGAAGLTCAAALRHLGATVDVLDHSDQPLHMQRGCSTRFLHPHVYDWPLRAEWSQKEANLPIMNWSANTADRVSAQLLAGYRAARGPEPYCEIGNLSIQRETGTRDRWRAEWLWRRSSRSKTYQVVILAVGFGLEAVVEFAPRISYWRLDTLGQTPLYEPNCRFLISGIGDGGLTDVARAMLKELDHSTLIEEYLSGPGMLELGQTLKGIEETANALAENDHAAAESYLARQYKALVVPTWFDAKLRARQRHCHVTLVGPKRSPFTLSTAIHNRLIVSRLLKLGLNYRTGVVRKVDPKGFGFDVVLEAPAGIMRGRKERLFVDHVVIRHGTQSALLASFPDVWQRLRERAPLPSIERAQRLWPNSMFVPAKGITSKKRSILRRTLDDVSITNRDDAEQIRLTVSCMKDEDGTSPSFLSYGIRHYWWQVAISGAPSDALAVKYRLDGESNATVSECTNGPSFEALLAAPADRFVIATIRAVRKSFTLKCRLKEHSKEIEN